MRTTLLTCLLGLALGVVPAFGQNEKKDEKKTVNTNEVAVLTTSEGTIVLEFWPDVAPGHVENFKNITLKKWIQKN